MMSYYDETRFNLPEDMMRYEQYDIPATYECRPCKRELNVPQRPQMRRLRVDQREPGFGEPIHVPIGIFGGIEGFGHSQLTTEEIFIILFVVFIVIFVLTARSLLISLTTIQELLKANAGTL
jgi:hypothetical protein